MKVKLADGNVKYPGAARLARELGVSHATVKTRMKKGMTLAQARADLVLKAKKIAAGLPVKGPKPADLKIPTPAEKRGDGKPYHQVANEIDRGYKPTRPTPDSRRASDEEDGTDADVDGIVESMAQIQKRKEKGLADQQEMKARVMRGELIEAAAVEQWLANMVIKARDILLRVGPELGERLAAEANPHKCTEMVDVKIREALSALKSESMPGKDNREIAA